MWLIRGCAAGQGMVLGLFVLNRVYNFVSPKQGVYFVNCPNHGPKMKGVVLMRVDILGLFLS